MKQSLLWGVALLLMATVSVAGGKHLFILSGQSNMVGMKPEVSFTPAVEQAFGKESVIVVKSGGSGKSIRFWCTSNHEDPPATVGSIPKVRGSLYHPLMASVKRATEGQTLDTITFVWMQGESDKRNPAYEAYLHALLKQLQNDLGRDDIHVVIGRISDCGLANSPEHDAQRTPKQKRMFEGAKRIRRIQVAFAESWPRGAWVDTDDLNDIEKDGIIHDDLHYTREGYTILGARFAEKAIGLIRERRVP